MRVRVDARLRLEAGAVSPHLLAILQRELSFPNPTFASRLRLGRSTWGVDPRLTFLRRKGPDWTLPRGAIRLLKRACKDLGDPLEVEDRRVLPEFQLPPLEQPALRDYQAEAVDRLVRATQGQVILPCGAGKTRTAIGAIAALRTPTLVLVHTLDLADQWRTELQKALGLDVGMIGGRTNRPAAVTVAVIQSLTRWPDDRRDALLRGFGLVVLDEAHHVAASTFHEVIDRCPARYRLGLTATPEREDGLTPLLTMFFGEPLMVVEHAALIAAGHLEVPEVHAVETAFDYRGGGPNDFGQLIDALVKDEARNQLVIDTVVDQLERGDVGLVLSGWVDHCERLADGLRARGLRVEVLTGKVPRAQRSALLNAARAGKVPVLVATSLADEGLDLPRLSRVFLAFPSRAKGRTVQRLGRLMRPHPEKRRPLLVDFVDARVPLLRRQFTERRRLYDRVLGTNLTTGCNA